MCLLTPASLIPRSAGDFVPGWLQCKDMDRLSQNLPLLFSVLHDLLTLVYTAGRDMYVTV